MFLEFARDKILYKLKLSNVCQPMQRQLNKKSHARQNKINAV